MADVDAYGSTMGSLEEQSKKCKVRNKRKKPSSRSNNYFVLLSVHCIVSVW